jgi:hypothetical protein
MIWIRILRENTRNLNVQHKTQPQLSYTMLTVAKLKAGDRCSSYLTIQKIMFYT